MADQAALLDPQGRVGDAWTTLERIGALDGVVESTSAVDIRVLIRRRRAAWRTQTRILAKPNTHEKAGQINMLQARSIFSWSLPCAASSRLRAYGQRSAPVASTGERRHLAMRHEPQGAFDS
jgi:hypothetical protein